MPRKTKKATSGKRTKRKQSGKGIKDVLKKVHSFVKSNKLISRGLRLTPYQGAANAAAMLGYGRKKKRKATSGKRARAAAVLTSFANLPIVSTRRKRGVTIIKNPISVGARPVRRIMAPSGATLARRAMGGRGVLSDLGGGIGSVFHGIFG